MAAAYVGFQQSRTALKPQLSTKSPCQQQTCHNNLVCVDVGPIESGLGISQVFRLGN